MLFAIEVQEIQKGDTIEDSVQRLEKKYYKVLINTKRDFIGDGKNIRVKLTNLTNDVDLYLKTQRYKYLSETGTFSPLPLEKSVPTIRENDCYSSNGKRKDEECKYTIEPQTKDKESEYVYILVYGFKAANYRLEVYEEAKEKIDTLYENEPKHGKIKKGESKQYKIYGKANETISATLFNLSNDADLRLKIGKKAGLHTFDCKSTNGKTKKDECSVTLKKDALVYVQVYGYQNTNYTIKGGAINPNNENRTLITEAKRHCLTQNNSTKNILCSNEKDIIYIIKNDDLAYTVDHTLYRVSIKENSEKVSIISHKSIRTLDRYFKKQLKDTPIFEIKYRSIQEEDSWEYILISPTGKELLKSFHSEEPGSPFSNYSTTDNGKKLIVDQYGWKNGESDDEREHTRITYDISNPNKAIFIKKEKIK